MTLVVVTPDGVISATAFVVWVVYQPESQFVFVLFGLSGKQNMLLYWEHVGDGRFVALCAVR